MTRHLRVLTVLSNRRLAERLQALLSRRMIEVNRVPSGAGALILTGNLGYDLIILEHPLTDLATEDFLASIRTLDSTSTNSPVLVLVEDELREAVAQTLNDELVKTLSKETDETDFHAAMSALLGVAARYAARVMVQIEVGLEEGISTRLYQAENLSESGMLLRGGRQIPIGTPVRFEFSLPSEAKPIAGIAQVVRHTTPGETTLGIALQFAELAEDNIRKLRQYAVSGPSGSAVAPTIGDPPGPEVHQQG